MNRTFRFFNSSLFLSACISLASPFCYADTNQHSETSLITGLTLTSIFILLVLSGIFLICVRKLIIDRNKLKHNCQRLQTKNDEFLDQKHQWLERETEILNHNLALETRLTARTETVNKVNHELTKALEALHQQNQKLNSLTTALENSQSKILIIDKHYQVCYASKPFLAFTGLSIENIKDQPLKRLEKHICLPEMASNGLTLNKDGLIDTQLKCLDKQGLTHWLDASIALSWSELKEILHYVVIFDDLNEAITSPSN